MLHNNLDKSNNYILFEEFYTYKVLDKLLLIKLYTSKVYINNNSNSLIGQINNIIHI